MTTYPYRPQLGDPLRIPATKWVRRAREDQLAKRMATPDRPGGSKPGKLGAEWHVIEWPKHSKSRQLPGFLAIGPGGIFSVSLVKHGREGVLIAGDIVQVNGKRPGYVTQARRDANQVAEALSAATGYQLKVFPVLAFTGSGVISVNGLPQDCVVTTYRELDQVLAATGRRISATTAEKLTMLARKPEIWSDGYRWFPDGETGSDKGTTRE